MNKFIYDLKKWITKLFPKFVNWVIQNKKFIYISYFLLFGILFLIPFCLYLFSGIGIQFDNLEGAGSAPSFNGVWFLDDYIGNNDKQLLGQYIPSWTSLDYMFSNTGFDNSNRYAQLAYQLYLMNKAVLPIWIAGIVFIVVPIMVYFLFKKIVNPWFRKNLESVDQKNNIEVQTLSDSSSNETLFQNNNEKNIENQNNNDIINNNQDDK